MDVFRDGEYKLLHLLEGIHRFGRIVLAVPDQRSQLTAGLVFPPFGRAGSGSGGRLGDREDDDASFLQDVHEWVLQEAAGWVGVEAAGQQQHSQDSKNRL